MPETPLATVAALTIAASLGSTALADSFAYIGNAGSNDISVFRLDSATGDMTPVETVAFAGVDKPGGSTPMAISPDRRFLFVGLRSEPYVALSYSIDPETGRLTFIGKGALADSMAYIATDRSGNYLFSASYGGNRVSVNPLGEDGSIGAPLQSLDAGLNAHAILATPDNNRVFATSLGSDEVLAFGFDASTGKLTPETSPVVKLAEKSGPRHFVFSPDGKFIYLLNELDGTLHAFSFDAEKGTWQGLQQTTILPAGFTGKIWGADLQITPDGRFIYASERTSSTIAGFSIDKASGKLTPIESVATEKQPRGFKIDPTGRYLAAVGEVSGSLSIHAIDQTTGALKLLKSYPVGQKPNWVEFVSFP